MSDAILPLHPQILAHFERELGSWLKGWHERGAFPQATLWIAARGSAERSWIHWLAQWGSCEVSGFRPAEEESMGGLFGEMPGSDSEAGSRAFQHPCGECAPCRRAFQNQSLDVIEVLPEEDEDESSRRALIKIDQLRELRETYGVLAPGSTYRLIVISNADRLTPQAANALLKLLEEPPRGWCFMLTAPDASVVLPTIVSRCLRLKIPPLPNDLLRALTPDLAAGNRELSIELAYGSLDRLEVLATPEGQDALSRARSFLEKPRQNSGALLDWIGTDLRKTSLALDLLEGLVAHRAFDAPPWQRALTERIADARRKLDAPLNRKLLLQAILLPCLESSLPPVR